MFRGIKDNWKKAEAAVVVQTLLEELARLGLFDGPPAGMAHKLIDKAWDARPELFDGRYGQRAHKLSVAATALAMAVTDLPREGRLYPAMMICLGKLLSGVEENAFLVPFTPLDERLLSKAREVFGVEAELSGADPLDEELAGLMGRG